MQLIAVVGSLTAGEIARSAMSIDLDDAAEFDVLLQGAGGTDVDRGEQASFALRRHPARVDNPKQRSARRNEMTDPTIGA